MEPTIDIPLTSLEQQAEAEDAQAGQQTPPEAPSAPHVPKRGRHGMKFDRAPKWPHDRRRRLRALLMARDSLTMSIPQVGKKYNVSERTVKRTLSYARRAELFTQIEDELLEGLAPKAKRVAEAAMSERRDGTRDDHIAIAPPSAMAVKVAMKVLEGTGLLRKAGTKSPADPTGQGESELGKWLHERRQRALEQENIIDGALVDAGSTLPTPGEPWALRAAPGDPGTVAARPEQPGGEHAHNIYEHAGQQAGAQGSNQKGADGPDGRHPAAPRPRVQRSVDENQPAGPKRPQWWLDATRQSQTAVADGQQEAPSATERAGTVPERTEPADGA